MFNKQRLDIYIKDQDALMKIAEEYIAMVSGSNESVNNVSLEDDGLFIETTYYSCGYSETEYYTMPIKYLMVENWKELELASQEKKKEEKERKQKEEEARRKKEKEEKEYQLFLELQKKYHDKDEIREWLGNILDLANIEIVDRANHDNMHRTSRLFDKFGGREGLIEKGWEVYNDYK